MSLVQRQEYRESTGLTTALHIDDIQELNVAGATYVLTKDLDLGQATTRQFKILAPGITFEGNGHTIRSSNSEKAIIHSKSSNVRIRNFVIEGSHSTSCSGILLSGGVKENIVTDNSIRSCAWGIAVNGSNNIIQNNTVENNTKGIHVMSGQGNIVASNIARNNTTHQGWGFGIWRANLNLFVNNQSCSNTYGMVIAHSRNNILLLDSYDDNSRRDLHIYNGSRANVLLGIECGHRYASDGSEYQEYNGTLFVNSEGGLAMRSRPDPYQEQLALIPFNAAVELEPHDTIQFDTYEGVTSIWTKVAYEDKSGWVFAGCLSNQRQ